MLWLQRMFNWLLLWNRTYPKRPAQQRQALAIYNKGSDLLEEIGIQDVLTDLGDIRRYLPFYSHATDLERRVNRYNQLRRQAHGERYRRLAWFTEDDCTTLNLIYDLVTTYPRRQCLLTLLVDLGDLDLPARAIVRGQRLATTLSTWVAGEDLTLTLEQAQAVAHAPTKTHSR